MGLGGFPVVSLAIARRKATEARKALAQGADPIDARTSGELQGRRARRFWQCVAMFMASRESGWRSAKHAAQWRQSLDNHAKPLWPVDEVDTEAVLAALQPLWQTIPETASRVRGRIEAVLDYAKAHGLRSGENPATWRGHLALILPKHGKFGRSHFEDNAV